MSIVKRKDSLQRTYYLNTKTGVRTTETAYKRSKSQFKTKDEYNCSSAGKKLQSMEKGQRGATKYGKALRSCGPKVTNKKGINQWS